MFKIKRIALFAVGAASIAALTYGSKKTKVGQKLTRNAMRKFRPAAAGH